ncbi:MAG: SURF1 family protein [Gammaproteobacteria bacterium]|nr:SURF1 family protein [Gammaproteobacteria bacterium]
MQTSSKLPVAASGAATKKTSVALIYNWPLTLLCAVLFPLLLWLGSWQLQQGADKARLQANITARLSAQPEPPKTLQQLQAFTPVRLQGHYTDELFYLDNRIRNGVIGYEILQVFAVGSERWLVNRGWVSTDAQRGQLPNLAPLKGTKMITGFLYPVTVSNTVGHEKGPRIQQLDSQLSGALNLLHPQWTVRLSADSQTVLYTGWQLINTSSQRHQAYAVQWFTMAAVLPILWVLGATNLRKKYWGINSRSY